MGHLLDFFLISLLLISNSFAGENWFSAESVNLDSIPCQGEKNVSAIDLKKRLIAKYKTTPKVESLNLNGVTFLNEYEGLINLFSKVTTIKKGGSFFLSSNEQKIFQLKDENCHDVFCAATDIWGENIGIKLLYLISEYGLNGASFLFEDSDEWTEEELNSVLNALTDIPSFILPIKKNHKLTHFLRGKGRSRLIANATFSFFDSWSLDTELERRYTVIHEMGHYVDSLFKISESKKWKDIITYEESVSGYSETNEGENFAESFAAFRYNPALLKKTNLEKYNFMKNVVFAGLDFETETGCKKNKILFFDLKKQIDENNDDKNELYSLNESSMCGSYFLKFLVEGERDNLLKCLTYSKIIKLETKILRMYTSRTFFQNGHIKYLKNLENDLFNPDQKIKMSSDFKDLIHDFVTNIKDVIRDRFSIYGFDESQKSEEYFKSYCMEQTKYSYQMFKKLDDTFGSSFSYNDREILNKMMYNFCFEIKEGFSKYLFRVPNELINKGLSATLNGVE